MDIRKTLHPGDMGTKRLLTEYGDQLVCVRYRDDKYAQKRFTTVELIIDERPLITNSRPVRVWVKINYDETVLRQQAKDAGAIWLTNQKAWEMDYETAKKLRLKKRIIKKLPHTNGQI